MKSKYNDIQVHAAHGEWAILYKNGALRCEGVFRGNSGRNHATGAAHHIVRTYESQRANAMHDQMLNGWVVAVRGDDACRDYYKWLLSHQIPVQAYDDIKIDEKLQEPNAKSSSTSRRAPPPQKEWQDRELPPGRHPDARGQRNIFDVSDEPPRRR